MTWTKEGSAKLLVYLDPLTLRWLKRVKPCELKYINNQIKSSTKCVASVHIKVNCINFNKARVLKVYLLLNSRVVVYVQIKWLFSLCESLVALILTTIIL